MNSSRFMSSPPQSANVNMPLSSPAGSRYTLNLAALDDSSSFMSPVATRPMTQILSDDIDGPSDFTLNLVDLIKGGEGRKSLKRKATNGASAILSGTPAVTRTATPRFQATVEDNVSELPPLRTPDARSQHDTLIRDPSPSPAPKSTKSTKETVSPDHEKEKASMLDYTEQLKAAFAKEREAHKEEMESMKAQHAKELETTKSELKGMLDYTNQLKAAFAKERAVHAEDMEKVKAQLESVRDDFEDATSAMEAEIALLKKSHEEELQEALANDILKDSHATEIGRVKRDLSESHAAEIGRVKKNLSESHAAEIERVKKDLSESHTAEIERVKEDSREFHAAEIERVKKDLSESHAAEIERVKDVNESHAAEVDRLKKHYTRQLKAAEKTTTNLEAAHTTEIQRIITDHTQKIKARDVVITEKVHARETRYKDKISARDEQLAKKDLEIEDLKKEMADLERLKRNLGKQLMRAWGREEFGDTGEKQMYRYRYTTAEKA